MANEVAVKKQDPIASYLLNEAVKKNIENVVGKKDAQQFISAVISTVQTTPALAECTNKSIFNAALIGHSLNLPHSPQLGYYYLVPFKNNKTRSVEAQFQMGYRGYIQLALRTGEYRKIHVTDIREGELKSYDPIMDEYEFEAVKDYEKRKKLPVVGYYAFFIYLNGGKKELYWSKEKMEAHAKKYSATYRGKYPESSMWSKDFDAMAYKTMIRQLISKWGLTSPNSTALVSAFEHDMAVIDESGQPIYVDNMPTESIESVQEELANDVAEEIGSVEDPAKAQTESGDVEGEQAKMPGF